MRSYPISIEWPNRWVTGAPPVAACHRGVRDELGLPTDMPIVLSVDRLDYTKGIEERFDSERVLERGARATFVQSCREPACDRKYRGCGGCGEEPPDKRRVGSRVSTYRAHERQVDMEVSATTAPRGLLRRSRMTA